MISAQTIVSQANAGPLTNEQRLEAWRARYQLYNFIKPTSTPAPYQVKSKNKKILMLIYLIIIILLVIGSMAKEVNAGIKLDHVNWYQVSANSLLVADWIQTRQAIGSGRFEENNPILGKQPSDKDVDVYFVAALAITNIIGSILQDDVSDMFYLTVATVQGKQVFDNYQVGVRIKF